VVSFARTLVLVQSASEAGARTPFRAGQAPVRLTARLVRDTRRAMSREKTGVVRKPLRVRERSSRTLDQRLFLRFPRLAAVSLRLIGRLPPGSRFRQAALWRGFRLAVEAYNRRDLDVVALGYHPDLEYYPYREFVEAGLAEPCYHGPSGYRSYIEATYEVWGTEVRLEPTELIDLGDRLVLLADMPMRAQASGIPLTETYAGVSTVKDGRVIRNHDYLDQTEALEAAGLRE
jgi:ketosteroid isomerase-like protein